jgi:hypothetical protein
MKNCLLELLQDKAEACLKPWQLSKANSTATIADECGNTMNTAMVPNYLS